MATKIELLSHEDKILSPITKASNVLFENGKTAQDILNDKQDENFTPKITSSNSMFKVGQGDNVDYSSNVVNGAYESMVLKGKSMVNCIQESSSQDVVLPYEFEEGRYVTINDTKESGALGVELKGQTLVNSILSIDKTLPYTWVSNSITSRNCELRGAFKTGVYALIVEFGEVLLGGVQSSQGVLSAIQVNYTDGTSNSYARSGLENYSKKRFFTTFTINKEVATIEFKGTATQYEDVTTEGYVPPTVTINKIMIIEYVEGMENWDIPYFEGMQSVKMPVLKTTGKNLIHVSKGYLPFRENKGITISRDEINQTITINGTSTIDNNCFELAPINNLKILKGETYTITAYLIGGVASGNYSFRLNDKGWSNAISTIIGGSLTKTKTYAQDALYIESSVRIDTGATFENAVFKVQFEKNTVSTSHEPYKSSILSLPEDVVLRSLPNGVCDTFNTRTGEYVQRIGERILDGSESQWTHGSISPTNVFELPMTNMKRYTGVGHIICDTLPYSYTNLEVWNTYTGVSPLSARGNIVLRNNNTDTIQDLKAWLSQNPTTICYELETPVVTKINLSPTLKSWNTTTHIYSEIPENTLYPILSHSNPTYPVILKPSTKYSIVANSYSNDHTNSTINFNLGGATATTTAGNRVTTITTPSALSNELLTMSGRGNKLNNVMVIEGDVVGDEPYFEGMCDSKSPILSNVGKNLANVDNYVNYPSENLPIIKDGEHSYIIENKKVGNWQNRVVDKVKLKANTTYTLSYDYELLSASVPMNYGTIINLRDDSDTSINISGDALAGKPRTFTPTRDTLARLCMYATDTSGGMNRIKFSNIQLEESSNRTEYEPYKSNILSCETYFDETTQSDKTIVLRSLPNGTCDTLNVETGEYMQRIGEIVLDGSETEWRVMPYPPQEDGTHYQFQCRLGDYSIGGDLWNNSNAILADRLPSASGTLHWGGRGDYGIGGDRSSIMITWEKNSCPFNDVTTLNAWLQVNPITVQYELATPIVSTIDVQGFPYAYTNGHVQLSSGHNEQSLTPKVEYSLPTNRNGQIRSNQKMVEKHQKELDKLQAIVLANLVNSQYNQTLTTLNYELSRV